MRYNRHRKSDQGSTRPAPLAFAAILVSGLVLAAGQPETNTDANSTTGSAAASSQPTTGTSEVMSGGAVGSTAGGAGQTTGAAVRSGATVTTSLIALATASGASADAIDAMKGAHKLVAPRTVVATQFTTLSAEGVADAIQGPIVLDGKQIGVRDSGSTEVRAIESGAELLKMFNLVRKKPPVGGRERDETSTLDLFRENADIKRYLGEEPTVVYKVTVQGTPLVDPMVIPWLKTGLVVEEMFDEAVEQVAQGNLDAARATFRSLIDQFPGTVQATQAEDLLNQINDLPAVPAKAQATRTARMTPTPPPTPTPVVPLLDPKVKVSTVLIDPSNPSDSRVVILNKTYKAGDKLRNLPDHKVLEIGDDKVIIEVEKAGVKKEFPIQVRPTGSN